MALCFADHNASLLFEENRLEEITATQEARSFILAVVCAVDTGCSNIRELSLHGISADVISNLAHVNFDLERLRLSHTDFVSSPAAALCIPLLAAASLTELSLSEMDVAANAVSALSSSLSSCSRLLSLNLAGTLIFPVDSEWDRIGLWKAISNMTSLTNLNLSSSAIDPDNMMCDSLSSLTALRLLDVSSISSGPSHFVRMFSTLGCHTALTSLNVSHNRLKTAGSLAVTSALASWPSLTSISLQGAGFERSGQLMRALGGCSKLQRLDLCGASYFGRRPRHLVFVADDTDDERVDLTVERARGNASAMARGLECCLPRCWPQLESLDIRTPGSCHEMPLGAEFVEALGHCRQLRSLRASSMVPPHGLSALTQLDLSLAADAKQLPAALMTMPALHTLKLRIHRESVGEELHVAACMAGCASALQHLTHLDLSDTALGSAGATALADALRGSTRLETLVLCRTAVCCEGAQVLAELPCLARLTTLEMRDSLLMRYSSGTDAGEQGALAVCRNLGTRLSQLDLSFTGLGPQCYRLLRGSLGACPELVSALLSRTRSCSAEQEAEAEREALALAAALKTAPRLRTLLAGHDEAARAGEAGVRLPPTAGSHWQ